MTTTPTPLAEALRSAIEAGLASVPPISVSPGHLGEVELRVAALEHVLAQVACLDSSAGFGLRTPARDVAGAFRAALRAAKEEAVAEGLRLLGEADEARRAADVAAGGDGEGC